MSWMIRVQNDRNFQDLNSDSSMFDVSTLFHPSLGLKVLNGEIDKISQYFDEEVNCFYKYFPMILLHFEFIFCRNEFWNNILLMMKSLKWKQMKNLRVEYHLNQFVFLVLHSNQLLHDKIHKKVVM